MIGAKISNIYSEKQSSLLLSLGQSWDNFGINWDKIGIILRCFGLTISKDFLQGNSRRSPVYKTFRLFCKDTPLMEPKGIEPLRKILIALLVIGSQNFLG